MSIPLDTTTIPIRLLNRNPFNPREQMPEAGLQELAASITSQGILQPLLITPLGLVVAGHRRLAAARLAGLSEVPVIVRELSQNEQVAIMLIENLQREDLSPIEEARGYKRLLDNGYTTAEVGRRIGMDPNRVGGRVLLLKLDPVVQTMIHRGDVPIGLAPSLAKLTDLKQQRSVATMAARQRLTVTELQAIIKRMLEPSESASTGGGRTAERTKAFSRATEQPVSSPGRKQIVDQLEATPDRQITLLDLHASFEQVCCSCGQSDLPEYCAVCPMVQLMATVLGAT
jgi:ParB family transcriptional regulator, chromosome partitioning protein